MSRMRLSLPPTLVLIWNLLVLATSGTHSPEPHVHHRGITELANAEVVDQDFGEQLKELGGDVAAEEPDIDPVEALKDVHDMPVEVVPQETKDVEAENVDASPSPEVVEATEEGTESVVGNAEIVRLAAKEIGDDDMAGLAVVDTLETAAREELEESVPTFWSTFFFWTLVLVIGYFGFVLYRKISERSLRSPPLLADIIAESKVNEQQNHMCL